MANPPDDPSQLPRKKPPTGGPGSDSGCSDLDCCPLDGCDLSVLALLGYFLVTAHTHDTRYTAPAPGPRRAGVANPSWM